MDAAQKMNMPAVALTDHGVLYGAIEFYKKAKAKGIKPILGCEVYMAPHGIQMHERKRAANGSQSNHFVLLAKDNEGYANLTKLVSKAHIEGFYYKPRIDKALLSQYSKGLIGLSACLKGEVAELCVQGDIDTAVERAEEYKEILGKDNFYIELQDHGIREQRIANEGLLEVAKRTNLPLVASNDVHYLAANHHEAHDIMICLQTQSVESDPKRMKYGSTQFYMKSAAEMWKLFQEHPEALSHTLEIAERCNVELRLSKDLHFPTYNVPNGFNQKSYLRHLTYEGLKHRYGLTDCTKPKNNKEEQIIERFEHEFEVIEKTGFINYFLVVWDFVRFSQDQCIPVGPGRGSGAGSIVAYALGITGIDPLKYQLIFERFLNPERVSPPDFDIDFCQTRRSEVIDYVKDKYGKENVAQIITFGTLGPKTVIRDIGRVLEIPLSECDRLAKMIPEDPGMTLKKALELNPDFRKATESEEHAKRIMKHAKILEGLPRNPGTHAAGVVIGEKPLEDLIPLTRDKDKEVVTQFEMKPLEQVGLLKMDFLGLRTLTLIQDTIDNVINTKNKTIDFETIPMDDKETFNLLNKGDTIGVFQVESKGMRDLLRRIGLTRFEDLIAMIALFRPGPMNMLDDYVNRKHEKVKITYDHPLLEPILKETYGVMLYQEQVLQAANKLAGFSLGQGDILRRAMGKKIKEEMASQRERFVDGCADLNNIPRPKAEKIFDNIEQFAGYGFNKSHSAAYAVLSYQTAYLKAHYPVEFMAALHTSEINNSDKLPLIIAEAQKMNIEVLPPDVNESVVNFRPVGDSIRFGLAGVKNVGVGAVQAIVEEREKNAHIQGLVDFCCRLDSHLVNKKAIESLVKCGAFDFTKLHRSQLFHGIEFALNRANEMQKDLLSGQGSLFDSLESQDQPFSKEELPPAKAWQKEEMLSAEKELLGFYISGHPLTEFEWVLKHYNLVDPNKLEEVEEGSIIRLGGLVTQFQKRFTKKTQEPMATFKLELLENILEVVAFPDTFREYGVHLREDAPILICGQFSKSEVLKIRASEVYPLKEVHRHFAKQVKLHLIANQVGDDQLKEVRTLLRRHPGEIPVILSLQFPSKEKLLLSTDHQFKVAPTESFVHEIEKVIGAGSVHVAINKQPCKHGDGKYKPRTKRNFS